MNTRDIATQTVNNILEDVSHISDCGASGKVVDFFEKQFPNEKQLIKEFRDELCDKTFDLYLEEHFGEIIFEQSI